MPRRRISCCRDLIAAIAPPGEVTSESAERIDAASRLIIPG